MSGRKRAAPPVPTLDDDDDGNFEVESSEDDNSVGSLKDFIDDKIVKVKGRNSSDVDVANVVTGKRVRKMVQKYVDEDYLNLMLEDVPDEEKEIAVASPTSSGPNSPRDTESDEEDYQQDDDEDDDDEEDEDDEEEDEEDYDDDEDDDEEDEDDDDEDDESD